MNMETNNYKLVIENIIMELKKFFDNIVTLNPPINPILIVGFEKKISVGIT